MIQFIMFIVVWTILSIWYFISRLGDKNKPEPWYAVMLMPPVLLIAAIIGKLNK